MLLRSFLLLASAALLAPPLSADVIAVLQAGFIGAWGEWHTSSNNLTTPARKAAVRDALLKVLPAGRTLQVRTPADLAQWYPQPATVQQALQPTPPAQGRIGLHNDCFLASPDDVGTYFAETPTASSAYRPLGSPPVRKPANGSRCTAEALSR